MLKPFNILFTVPAAYANNAQIHIEPRGEILLWENQLVSQSTESLQQQHPEEMLPSHASTPAPNHTPLQPSPFLSVSTIFPTTQKWEIWIEKEIHLRAMTISAQFTKNVEANFQYYWVFLHLHHFDIRPINAVLSGYRFLFNM